VPICSIRGMSRRCGRQGERLLLIVGDEDAGEADRSWRARSHSRSATRTPGIERAERLGPRKQEARLDREGAARATRWRCPRRELRREAPLEPLSWRGRGARRRARRISLRLGRSRRRFTRGEGDVVEDRDVAEERVVLEDEADLALAGRQAEGIAPPIMRRPALACSRPGDDAQEAGLARARGARSAMNSPSSTTRSMPSSTLPWPKFLARPSMVTLI